MFDTLPVGNYCRCDTSDVRSKRVVPVLCVRCKPDKPLKCCINTNKSRMLSA